MPRIRSEPDVLLAIVEDRIDRFAVPIEYKPDGTVDVSNTKLSYTLAGRTENGKALLWRGESVSVQSMPPTIKSALRLIYQWISQDADAKGLMGAGTDQGGM